ncbi:hypothetical protein RB195_013024 [Necator americanus]|uniref:Uncharacterized protein n=1 Tax=Necator americanus TaxID=51031 RepID=A0ABR1DTQ0_NECAM
MHISSTECANPFLSDLTQKILGVETILLCIISLFLQLLMLKVSCKFCGWKSDFSYVLLCMMSVVGMVFYVIELIGHIRFTMLASPSDIDRFIGANFLATIFTNSMIGVLLMAHRFIYTIIPFKAARILNPTFLKMDMALVVCFFISLLCFLCTPMAGVMFCSQSMARHIMELPLKFLIDWMNTISNYMVGVCTVITYTLLAGVLIARGNIRLRNNAELRMMIQKEIEFPPFDEHTWALSTAPTLKASPHEFVVRIPDGVFVYGIVDYGLGV